MCMVNNFSNGMEACGMLWRGILLCHGVADGVGSRDGKRYPTRSVRQGTVIVCESDLSHCLETQFR